jgi:hypothetical protein
MSDHTRQLTPEKKKGREKREGRNTLREGSK